MPLYMDIHHKIDGLTAEAIKGAHEQDVKVQKKHGVTYHKYWFDAASGKAFCLVEAPSKEAANALHVEAHGRFADGITEVQEGAWLGRGSKHRGSIRRNPLNLAAGGSTPGPHNPGTARGPWEG